MNQSLKQEYESQENIGDMTYQEWLEIELLRARRSNGILKSMLD